MGNLKGNLKADTPPDKTFPLKIFRLALLPEVITLSSRAKSGRVF